MRRIYRHRALNLCSRSPYAYASLKRLTDRAHIIEAGADTYRYRRTVRKAGPSP
jgi:hypothetical protein